MKLYFSLIIKGGDKLEKRLKDAIESNPRLHVDLIEAFTSAIVKKLNIRNEDDISIEGFKAARIPDDP